MITMDDLHTRISDLIDKNLIDISEDIKNLYSNNEDDIPVRHRLEITVRIIPENES